MKCIIKKVLIFALAAMLLLVSLPTMERTRTLAATGNQILTGTAIETRYGEALLSSDGKVYYEEPIVAVNFKNGSYTTKTTGRVKRKELLGIDEKGNQSWLYCVEKNTAFSKDGYNSSNVANSQFLQWDTGTLVRGLNQLAKDKKIKGLDGNTAIRNILTATIYGWQPDAELPQELLVHGLNAWDWYFGTQVVIWEFQQGIRQSPTVCNGNGFNEGDALYCWLKGRPAEYAYHYVLCMIEQHTVIPSFCSFTEQEAPIYTLKWNNERQRYEITLTDTAKYAFDLCFDNNDFGVEKKGNQYLVYTTQTTPKPVLCAAKKEMHIAENQKLLVWGKAGKQTMVTGKQDPVLFFIKLQTEKPTITIDKTGDEKEDIANRIFHIYKDSSNMACLILTTDERGFAKGELPGDGNYKVVEQNSAPYQVSYSAQEFACPGPLFAENNNITIQVENKKKTGKLEIKKISEDGIVEGCLFEATRVNEEGTPMEVHGGYTDKNGKLSFWLEPGVYVIKECDVPSYYETPQTFTVTIKVGETITRTVENKLKPAYLKIIKQSEDGIVAGIQFEITGTTVKGESILKRVITGSDGTVIAMLEQGTYKVTECNLSAQYYPVSAKIVSLVSDTETSVVFQNRLKPGYLKIVKESEDGMIRGMKFRIRGNGVDITGFTNEQGYVVFGEKAYWLTGKTIDSTVERIAVVSKDATVAEIFSDLGLPLSYKIGGGTTATLNEVLGSTTYGNGSIIGSGRVMILDTKGKAYAQIVFKGSVYDGSAADGYYGVTAEDLAEAKKLIGKSMDGTYSVDIYIAAYDINRDGIITQSDINVLQNAHQNRTDLVYSTTLNLHPGTYQITEVEVPSRYTDWFEQTVTIIGGETKVVTVKNYLKKGGVIIVKTAEDNILSGHQFRIIGRTELGKTVDMVVTTDEKGMVRQDLEDGDYTLEEINVPNRYYLPQEQYGFGVVGDYIVFEMENKLKPGTLQLIKQSEDNFVAAVAFRIQSLETVDGSVIDKTIETNQNGEILFDFPQGTYVITELNVPNRYVLPESKIVEIKAGEVSNVTFQNVLKVPTLKIIKTSEDGIVGGVKFQVSGTTVTGQIYTKIFTTDDQGLIFEKIPQGTYEVKEIQKSKYIPIEAQTVTLADDCVTIMTVNNVLKQGTVKIQKESEDGAVANISFQITGIGEDGRMVDMVCTTDNEGIINIQLKPGTYTISEVQHNEKYVIAPAQQVTVMPGETVNVLFENLLKKFQLTVIKRDSVSGVPLEGAQYGLYKEDDTFIAQYVTDKNGKFITDALLCERTYVKEIKAPDGYFSDETQYWLNSSYDSCFLDVTSLSLEVVDNPVVGNITVIKKMGTEENWEYESGAVFEVYLKSAGSYDAAKEWERDLLVTDEATDAMDNNLGENTTGGMAGTKDLPMGTYVVRQRSGTEGFYLAEDKEVIIDKENTAVILEILNVAEVELPNTGGSGIGLFYVGGIGSVLLSGLGLIWLNLKNNCNIRKKRRLQKRQPVF